MEKRKHIIDPHKLTAVWGIKWKNYVAPERLFSDNIAEDDRADTSSFIFDMPNKVKVSFHDLSPNELVIRVDERGVVRFDNMTNVYYFVTQKMFVAESISSNFFNEIRIYKSGDFALKTSRSMSEHKHGFASSYSENEPKG